jgi:hypothetical protein
VSELLDSALRFANGGNPVLAVKPHSKEPATPHGVKDATIDPERIRSWWQRWPDANVGVECGAPGPHVLDVDDPAAYRQLDAGVRGQIDQAPTVATARGYQFYFAGATTGTIVLPFGELRGRGSYVVAPPSVHPTGKLYTWVAEPHGPLPAIPSALARHGQRAGTGVHAPPPEPFREGEGRWPYLKDIAVHLVRGGIVDEPTILALLWAAFQHGCEQQPPPQPGKIEALAAWAARSDIAGREAERAQSPELRHELAQLLRIDPLRIEAVRLRGNGPGATLELDLSNGLEIITERFGDLYSHVGLARFVTQNVGIDAGAITKNDATRASALIRRLADITRDVTTGDLGVDHGIDFLRDAPVERFTFNNQADRYRAFTLAEERDYRPNPRGLRLNVRITDPADSLVLEDVTSSVRFVRCGHLFEFVRSSGQVAHPAELAKRMVLAGWTRRGRRGRIKATSVATTHTITLGFWHVPPGWEESCLG